MSPGAYHRVVWREVRRERLLRVANTLALAGTVCVAVAISSVVFVVTHLLYPGAAGWLTGLTALVLVGLWFVLPMVDRRRT